MIRRSQTRMSAERLKMAALTSKSEIQTCSYKILTNFDKKISHDVNKFPNNFSGVPHIGQKIFGFLDFKDLYNCQTVCKGWQNFLGEERSFWIELLEKEKIKIESSENFDSDDFSDCSDDSLDSLDSVDTQDILRLHVDDDHDPEFLVFGGKDPMESMQDGEMDDRYMIQEILEKCDECSDEKDERLKKRSEDFKMEELKANHAGWYWLIEKVKNGPVSDIICLIPKICLVNLFGNIFEANHVTEFQQDYLSVFKLMIKHDALLSYSLFLRKAIQAKNVEMVKFVAPKIKASHFSTETYYVQMVANYRKLAKEYGNKEISEFLNSWTDSGSDDFEEWLDSYENFEEKN